jgi:uncharacterized protein with NRDE domain
MCLIVFAWQTHPDYPLIVLANRDEFHARPTRQAAWWGQSVSLLGGRDEDGGGTWLAINRQGRMAFLTNVRQAEPGNIHAPSRGLLPVGALQHPGSLASWATEHPRLGRGFNGYNLVVVDPLPDPSLGRDAQLLYASNRDPAVQGEVNQVRALGPGVYGLSNAALDTPWPKLTRAVGAFACQIADKVNTAALLRIMADRRLANDMDLPVTGVSPEWERVLSAIQVHANGYGTRSTTLCTVRRDGLVQFTERSFDTAARLGHTDREFEFMVDSTRAPRLPRAPQRVNR